MGAGESMLGHDLGILAMTCRVLAHLSEEGRMAEALTKSLT
jgi:hypothetical protein